MTHIRRRHSNEIVRPRLTLSQKPDPMLCNLIVAYSYIYSNKKVTPDIHDVTEIKTKCLSNVGHTKIGNYLIFIPLHTLVSGYYVIPFGVCLSVRAHHFRSIT